jgi:hypothetical protein
VIIGDTGCRIEQIDDEAYKLQDCGDPHASALASASPRCCALGGRR